MNKYILMLRKNVAKKREVGSLVLKALQNKNEA